MSRKVAWIAAGIAGLLAAGGVTAASAAAAPPVAAPHWHIVFKSSKPDPANGFTAVVATGKTTGWAFDGTFGGPGPTDARRKDGSCRSKRS